MKKKNLILILLPLLAATLACSMFNDLTNNTDVVEDVISEIEDEINAAEDIVESEIKDTIEEVEDTGSSISDQLPESPSDSSATDFDSVFPLPDDVQNFTGQGDESQVNFQTSLSLEDAIEFYRQTFKDENLFERDITTTITEEAFSMVFDGHGNGKAVVIQGVDLGGGITNINIRFEDL